MKKRLETLTIMKNEQERPDTETEKLKADIARMDGEIHKLMDKLADADEVLFDYIQKRVKELHARKSETEDKLNTRERKKKAIDTSPLAEPLAHWDELTVDEKHDVAVTIIDNIRVSDETGVDISFSI